MNEECKDQLIIEVYQQLKQTGQEVYLGIPTQEEIEKFREGNWPLEYERLIHRERIEREKFQMLKDAAHANLKMNSLRRAETEIGQGRSPV